MLKADLHIHVKEDPEDNWIPHSSKDLIDYMASKGFEVLSITGHDKLIFTIQLKEYAEKKGIVLIPGMERTIEGKHVLLYNFKEEEYKRINSFKTLRKYKNKGNLIIAPHPFYPKIFGHPLGEKFLKNLDLFDAIEFSSFTTRLINWPNKKALKIAKKFNLPLVGNSDAHHPSHLNTSLTFIDSKKSLPEIIQAIKKRKIKHKTEFLPLSTFLFRGLWMTFKCQWNKFKAYFYK